jgi:hypothetical protein
MFIKTSILRMIYSKNFRLAAIAKRTGGNREAYRIAYRPTEYGEEQGSCTAKLLYEKLLRIYDKLRVVRAGLP